MLSSFVNNGVVSYLLLEIKIFVLIISGKISGNFSDNLPTGIFNQLFKMQFLIKKIVFLPIMSRFSKVNLENYVKPLKNIELDKQKFYQKIYITMFKTDL